MIDEVEIWLRKQIANNIAEDTWTTAGNTWAEFPFHIKSEYYRQLIFEQLDQWYIQGLIGGSRFELGSTPTLLVFGPIKLALEKFKTQ